MFINHIAIWVNDLEKMKNFYEKFFSGNSNEKYSNPKKNYESYFISFDSGARIELMKKLEITDSKAFDLIGYAHIAFSVGSKEKVDEITENFRENGIKIFSEPRTTGDGYYESVIEDFEGNLIEITE
jgi:lactoylglutathione lyase